MTTHRKRALTLQAGSALLLVIIALTYAPLRNAGFVWDDFEHLVDNALIQDPAGLGRIWTTVGGTPQFYPLTFTAFWLQHLWWGLEPLGYHLVNVILFWLVCTLLWRLFRELDSPVAWWGACLFAVHPVNVMSVAWITELKNVLSGSLLLGATLIYAKCLREREAPPPAWRLVAVFALYLLAMTAKTASSFLPFTLLLLNAWRLRRPSAREWFLFLLMVAVAGTFAVITIRWESMTKYAVESDFSLTWPQRWIVFGTSFWFYLSKALFPVNLSFFYDRWTVADPPAVWQNIFPLAALALVSVLAAARARIGRGPALVLLHYTVTTSALILIHVLYMTRYTWVADHWQFFGLLGLLPSGAWILHDSAARLRIPTGVAKGLAVSACIVLAIVSRSMCGSYADLETFYRAILERTPSSWLAHNNLGDLLHRQGRLAEAESHYKSSLALRSDNAEAVNNYGALLFETGRAAEAERHFREAIRLQPQLPGLLNNLGRVLAMQDKVEESATVYEQSLKRNPNDVVALTGLGIAKARLGLQEEAAGLFGKAVSFRPHDATLHGYLAQSLADTGRHADAVRHFLRSAALNPDQPAAVNAAAWILATSPRPEVRQGDMATRLARQAVALEPDNASFHGTLAAALAESGDFKAALVAADRAIELASAQGLDTLASETASRRARYAKGVAISGEPSSQ